MGFRFYRRVRLFPGVSVNLSLSGPSLSVGMRGAHVTVGRRGMTRTVGIPGTGIFYTSRRGTQTGLHTVSPVDTETPSASGGGLWLVAALVAAAVAFVLFAGR